MNDPIEDAKSEVAKALAARQGEPATNPTEAAQQIEELRRAMTVDLDTLRHRVPAPSEISGQTRRIGGAIGAGSALLGIGAFLLKRRGQRRSEQEAVRVQAAALAREIARLEMAPEALSSTDSGGRLGKITLLLMLLGTIAVTVAALRRRLRGDDEAWDQPV